MKRNNNAEIAGLVFIALGLFGLLAWLISDGAKLHREYQIELMQEAIRRER